MARGTTPKRWLTLLLVLTGSLLACDDTQEPVVPGAFHLQIFIHDSQGLPVPDLRVSTYNNLPETLLPDAGAACAEVRHTSKALAVASIRFCMPEAALIRVFVLDAEGVLVRRLVDQTLPAGAHALAWDARDEAGLPVAGGVYAFHLRAHETDTQARLFADSTLALLHRGADGVLGYSDARGLVETRDRLRFPSLLGLDSLQARDAEGVDHGAFQVLDSIRIVVVDTLSGMSQCFETRIVDAPQEIRLTWEPQPSPQSLVEAVPMQPAEIPVPGPPGDWPSCGILVWPNPFN